jgi:hypothetical protein
MSIFSSIDMESKQNESDSSYWNNHNWVGSSWTTSDDLPYKDIYHIENDVFESKNSSSGWSSLIFLILCLPIAIIISLRIYGSFLIRLRTRFKYYRITRFFRAA